ncbi:MAG: integration host factor subunit beta, partial [Pirellulales bacterium]|nr:integration host factor subunit beta [Pirellulales bacterium]
MCIRDRTYTSILLGLSTWGLKSRFRPQLHDWSVKVMTKQDIVRTISERLDLPKAKAQEAVQTTFDALINALVKEGRVELRNFGIFQIKRRDGRVARNPRTGDVVNVPPRYFVSFKPGKEMEARVRNLDKPQSP